MHTHLRCNDTFIFDDNTRLKELNNDFMLLTAGSKGSLQKIDIERVCDFTYSDDQIISLLIEQIKDAKTEIKVATSLGIFLKNSTDLVEALKHAYRNHVKVIIYYSNIPNNIEKELQEAGITLIKGVIYPRLHYWIIDNFIYESCHPRHNEEFIYHDDNRSNELRDSFNKLIKENSSYSEDH